MTFAITPRMRILTGPKRGKFPYCYCLLIEDQIRVLLDSSCGPEHAARLRRQGLDIIVNTHFHLDHTLLNQQLGEVEIWCHGLDAPGIRSMEAYQDMYGFAAFGAPEQGIKSIETYQLKPGSVHRELKDGDLLDFGQVKMRVIHTPGHTPGHCSFYEENSGILVTGDIDLTSFGPWYGHQCSDLDDLLASIQKCMDLQPRLVVSGHKGIVSKDLPVKFLAYRDCILRKDELVWQALDKPLSLEQMAARGLFYGTLDIPTYYRVFEKQGVFKHLERLMRLGLIGTDGEYYYRT